MRKLWRWVKSLFIKSRKPSGSKEFRSNEARQDRLVRLYETMQLQTIGRQNINHVHWYVNQCKKYKLKYFEVGKEVNVPWEVVACVHALEASFDFSKNLMNGQPYTQKTTWVPRGFGPWKDWHSAAIDAFKLKKQQGKLPAEWTLGSTLEFLLLFNGTGYERKGLVSPYLFSYTNHYVAQGGSKYVSDGKFDRNAISLQVGAAVILKELGYNPEQ